ncbi:MAG: 1-acyl-sn-glycerol-3-phosphate acyltransferase [Leptospiraceae bacterium]|nr:1-acyl-sn-glycerol-3-phosphate acyltransferase [Leptospiraceae bacterium]
MIGHILFLLIVVPMRAIYGAKRLDIYDDQILEDLKNRSFIIVSNHILPKSRFLRAISMPYDAYLLRRMFLKHDIKVTAFTSIDSLQRPRSKLQGFWMHSMKEPLMKGLVVSLDLIPLNRRVHDNATQRDLRQRLDKGGIAVGIFPEGTMFTSFSTTRKLHAGMGVYAKRYDLPVLPVYLHAYNTSQPMFIRVGQLIAADTQKDEIVKLVRTQWNTLAAMGAQSDDSVADGSLGDESRSDSQPAVPVTASKKSTPNSKVA